MFFGTNASLVKRQSATQVQPTTGFLKTKFAHKAAAGDTQINLTSLTIPTEMSANGFSNPTVGQIAAASLLFYRRNLTLWSSLRGRMTDFYQYSVSSSSALTFIGFTAEEGEIFEGTIDYQATTGFQIAATISPPATGSLAAGTTDFNVGFSFQVNANPTTQMGNVTVYRGGQAQLRNVGNATASVSADGDYQEVDLGTGFGQIIRFNRPDPDNTAPVIVIPNGRLMELPTGSMMAVIENLNGQINSMATYVAALAGVALTTVLGSAATNTDLKAFGDRVIALEANRARIDLSNVWTVAQNLVGKTDGSSFAAGIIGQDGSVTNGTLQSLGGTKDTFLDIPGLTLTLQPGVYLLVAQAVLQLDSVTGGGAGDGLSGWITIRNSAGSVIAETCVTTANLNLQRGFGSAPVVTVVNISTTTTYKMSALAQTISATVSISNVLIRGDYNPSQFYYKRIG